MSEQVKEQKNQSPVQGSETPLDIAKTQKTIDKSRRIQAVCPELAEMLVTQLGKELSNKHLYNTFANYYDTDGLPKLAEYFKLRSNEEELHHKWIFEYLNYNDVEFTYPGVDAIDIEIKSRVEPFLLTVDKEIETTTGINTIVKKAMDLGDWATFGWLMGCGPIEGKLVPEQIVFSV
jgi:ferritin